MVGFATLKVVYICHTRRLPFRRSEGTFHISQMGILRQQYRHILINNRDIETSLICFLSTVYNKVMWPDKLRYKGSLTRAPKRKSCCRAFIHTPLTFLILKANQLNHRSFSVYLILYLLNIRNIHKIMEGLVIKLLRHT